MVDVMFKIIEAYTSDFILDYLSSGFIEQTYEMV